MLFPKYCYFKQIFNKNYRGVYMMDQQKMVHQCPVCLSMHPALYAVANCQHRFCLQCSLQYINSQANNFASARCLEEGCGQPLDKKLPIYGQLDEQTINKLQQFEKFQFLQKNHDYKSCKVRDCKGVFNSKEGRCQTCQTIHCKKCAELFHDGACTQSQEQAQMKNLHYRRCPKCRIWIQKKQGCEYINCKCGTQFCYKCGNEFRQDPCRMKDIWESQAEMRTLLSQIVLKCPQSPKQLCIILVKMLAFSIVSVITLAVVLGLVLLGSAIFIAVIALFLPFALCQPISQTRSTGFRTFFYILFILGYPLLVGLVSILMLAIIILYPFCRNCNHHGIYDPFNKGMVIASTIYLKIAKYIVIPDSQ